MTTDRGQLRLGTSGGRWVLFATVLGSAMVFLDSTVVNVALPAVGEGLDTDVAGLQWVLSGYLLTLSAFILLGGSLGDRYGRRRVFTIGVVCFAAASALCAAAPTEGVLVVARVLQGAGGALLTPGSLAIIQASFAPGQRGRAVGVWSGFTALSTAVGPLLGGWLVDLWSWRLIFLANVPLALATFVVARRHVPETRDRDARDRPLDVTGAVLAAAALAAVTWTFIELGREDPAGVTPIAGVAGLVALAAFLVVESRTPNPMVPLAMFRNRQFTGANLATVAVYSALGGYLFLLVAFLQVALDYSPLSAGAATLPVTVLLAALSSPMGALADRIGPRFQMTVGPLVMAGGMLLTSYAEPGSSYEAGVLPGLLAFGLGLATTVAPLTATALGAVPERRSGLASGVNNTVARASQLVAVAVLPGLAGITGPVEEGAQAFVSGFGDAARIAAAAVALGGLIALALVRQPLNPDAGAREAA